MKLILSCEHASNAIPEFYQHYFVNAVQDLQSHKGWDIGAGQVFDFLAREFGCFAIKGQYSRLLIELNRSLKAKDLFSVYSQQLSETEKSHLIETYYQPYIEMIQQQVQSLISKGEQVLHLSIHSFTPELNGEVRNSDIGLLYDSRKESEKAFCANLRKAILQQSPDFIVRKNYPYRGDADGLTTMCRKKFPENYLGIEIEVNQKLLADSAACHQISLILINALKLLSRGEACLARP